MKRIGNSVLIFALLFVSANCIAQTENINTDRPDQSDGVYTIPKNKFQLEEGVFVAKEAVLNDFMLRYGVTKSTELRLLLDAGKEGGARGMKPVTLSAKQRITEQHKIIPAITFAGYVSFGQLASKDFSENQLPFEMKLAFENELTDKFSLAWNVGASNEFKALDLTLNFSYAPTDKISTFIEYFSTIQKPVTEHNIDAGILYLLNPRLQIDLACGGSIAGPGTPFFTTFGISYIFR